MATRRLLLTALLLGASALSACGGNIPPEVPRTDGGSGDGGADAGDAGGNTDAGGTTDAGDAGGSSDAGDAGGSSDAGDGGGLDAGTHSVPDLDLRREALQQGADPRVIFRYRSYTGTRPASVSPGSTTITHTAGQGVISTARGAELSPFLATQFDGVNDGYLGDAGISSQAQGLTIQAWFRPTALNGYRTLFSNTEGNRGFSLKVVDGNLRVLVRLADGATTANVELADPNDLIAGEWVHGAAQVAVIGTDVRLRLYRNGVLVAESSDPALDGIAQSTSKPAVGSEPTGSALDTDWFQGEMSAVTVHNYPVDHDVLVTPQLQDGSRYLGAPGYHDYLDGTPNTAERIATTDRAFADMASVRVRYGLPLLNDDFLPESPAVAEDGRKLWIAAHSADLDGGNPAGRASVVVEVDLDGGTVTRVIRLLDATNANVTVPLGGLGVLAGHLYVPADQKVIRYRLADAVEEVPAQPGFQPGVFKLAPLDSFATRNGGSFLDVDLARRAIWVGEFKPFGGAAGSLDRYDLTSDGQIARPSTTASDERITLPVDLVQGAVARPGATLKFWLSQSFGEDPSTLYDWTPGSTPSPSLSLPGGLGGLDLGPDGTVWSTFESGATFNQKNTAVPWTDLSPYLVGLTP